MSEVVAIPPIIPGPLCNTLVDPLCVLVKKAASSAANSVTSGAINDLAAEMQKAVGWLIQNSITLWLNLKSPDLTTNSIVPQIQQWLLPITAAVAVGATLMAAARMAVTGKPNPLLDVGQGIVIIAVAMGLGVSLPTLLLKAGDSWSDWVIGQSVRNGDFAKEMTTILVWKSPGMPGGLITSLCTVSLLMATVQAMLMLFRIASLIILAGVLPLAAAGSLTAGTRIWIKKIAGWMLALIFYKPAAATVYAVAFKMIGSRHDFVSLLSGFMMLALSLVALPVLMKFFTWTVGSAQSPGGGGLLGSAVSGAMAVGSFRAGGDAGSAASNHASNLRNSGPDSPGEDVPGSPSGGGGDASSTVRSASAAGSAAPAAPASAGGAASGSAAASAGAAATGPAAPVVISGTVLSSYIGEAAKDAATSATEES